jgi:hypothetical protein
MATMISEVYEAFRSVGVSEDKARAAAEARSEEQLATKADISRLEQVLKADINRLEKELLVIKWMTGLVIAAVVIPLIRQFLS